MSIGQNRDGVRFLKSGEHTKGGRIRVSSTSEYAKKREEERKKPKSKLKRFLIKHFKRI